MSTTVYNALSKLHARDAGLYQALCYLAPKIHESVFREALKSALAGRLDEEGVSYFRLLMYAVRDTICLPYAESQQQTYYVMPDSTAATRALKRARSMCAKEAMSVFNETNSFCLAQCKETTKALFQEVANWWRDTDDEKEADDMFVFLRHIGTQLSAYGSWVSEAWDQTLREATNRRFPEARLLRHFKALNVPGHAKSDERIAHILALAWVRSKSLDEIGRYMDLDMSAPSESISVRVPAVSV